MKCFRCGKTEAVHDGLCRECYLETHRLLDIPDYMDIHVCAHCGAASPDGKRWEDTDDFRKSLRELCLSRISLLKDASVMSAETSITEQDSHSYVFKGRLLVKVGEIKEEVDFGSKVRIKSATCSRCSRIHGGYYEAIIQIRGAGREMSPEEKIDAEEFVASRVEEMGRHSREIFITQEEEVHGGLDLYISSSRAAKTVAKSLAEHLSGSLTESKKLAGRKEGEDFYRFTYSVRLPKYKKGDFVEYLGKYYRIRAMTGDVWRLAPLEGGSDIKVRDRDARKFRILARKEDAEEAVAVSFRNGEVQVLHPENYRTVTLKYPGVPGEKVKVIRINGELYSLPDDE